MTWWSDAKTARFCSELIAIPLLYSRFYGWRCGREGSSGEVAGSRCRSSWSLLTKVGYTPRQLSFRLLLHIPFLGLWRRMDHVLQLGPDCLSTPKGPIPANFQFQDVCPGAAVVILARKKDQHHRESLSLILQVDRALRKKLL